uniref:Ig-like domain-containing protein n=1 Tax=Oncorhynchus kisutch TaxID=8019 RepID=A0A8C7JAD8_ONCKI
ESHLSSSVRPFYCQSLVKIVTPQGLLYPGETVTLRCDISDYTDWTYRWFRNNEELPIQTRKTITISLPDQAGQYRCVGRRRDRPQKSYRSSALPIIITGEVTVCLQSGLCKFRANKTSAELPGRYPDVLCIIFTALPKTTLTIEPNPAFTGEKVTLKCSVRSYSIWSYKWYKDRNDNVVSQSGRHTITGDTLTINGATVNEGPYWCQGERDSRPTSSSISDPVTITVNALPVASVSVSSQGLLYSGETVSLQCVIPAYTDWRYYWYKNNQHLPDETSKVIYITIPITQTGQAGQYWCEGNRVSRPTSSLPSDPVTLTVKGELLCCALLMLLTIYIESIRVCVPEFITMSSKMIGTVKHVLLSQPSDYVTISVTGKFPTIACITISVYYEMCLISVSSAFPKATLTVKPNPVFPGETVTLTCSVGSDSIWSYKWYKDRNDNVVSQSVRHTITGDTLTISSVAESDHGLYWCQGEIQSRSISSIISDSVTITLNGELLCSVFFCHSFVFYIH